MKKTVYIIALLLLTFSSTYSQDFQPNDYLKFLENYEFTDTLSIEDLFVISKRKNLRQSYINKLQREINDLDKKITDIQTYIAQLNNELQKAKQTYSKLLIFLYLNKNYNYSGYVYLMTAKSLNEAYFRLKYLKLITDYLHNTAKTITLLKKELEYQKDIINKSIQLRKQLIRKISRQQALYQEDFALLQDIQNHQQAYKLLKSQVQDYEFMQRYLSSKVRENIESTRKEANTSERQTFENLKGTLNPPLNNPVIIIPFGVHEHQELKDIKIRNDGIDITSFNDTIVKAVYKGKVSKIVTLPNSKYAVILKHGDYFTVYSNLSRVLVEENQNVQTGQSIGIIRRTGSEKYATLNFQIWHLTEKLNPQNWLRL